MGTKRVGFARIKALINENTNALKHRTVPVTTITGDTTLTSAESGNLVAINYNTGATITVTLPTPANGLVYDFVFVADMTNNSAKIRFDGLEGGAMTGVVVAMEDDGTGQGAKADGGSDRFFDVDGDPDVRAASKLRCECADGSNWTMTGIVIAGSTAKNSIGFASS
jgi:hypothetical protein